MNSLHVGIVPPGLVSAIRDSTPDFDEWRPHKAEIITALEQASVSLTVPPSEVSELSCWLKTLPHPVYFWYCVPLEQKDPL